MDAMIVEVAVPTQKAFTDFSRFSFFFGTLAMLLEHHEVAQLNCQKSGTEI